MPCHCDRPAQARLAPGRQRRAAKTPIAALISRPAATEKPAATELSPTYSVNAKKSAAIRRCTRAGSCRNALPRRASNAADGSAGGNACGGNDMRVVIAEPHDRKKRRRPVRTRASARMLALVTPHAGQHCNQTRPQRRRRDPVLAKPLQRRGQPARLVDRAFGVQFGRHIRATDQMRLLAVGLQRG